VIGMTIIFGTIAMFLWTSAPRLLSDAWHPRDFVPAQSQTITDYKCTNWNGGIVNECTARFVSPQSGAPRQITDWRFGPAPRESARLLQRRDDVSAVTTDVSLRTLWNRVALALTLVLFGVVLAIALMVKAIRAAGAPGWDSKRFSR
jgi:hypothetical protein